VWVRRACAIGLTVGVLGAAYMLWLRDSSLFAVKDVQVVGVSSAEREEVRDALTSAAREMTTLHVSEDRLRAAVRSYPSVRSVSADARLPTGLTIEVAERKPVALVGVDGRDLPVAGDGTVLAGISTAGLDLPLLDASAESGAAMLDGTALEQARVLGAAPAPLRPLIEASSADSEGIEVTLADDISLRFGDASRVDAKWTAAARILADGELGGLSYIDLSAPERPAVGGAAPAPGPA
jgi:cell division protein FtsQ